MNEDMFGNLRPDDKVVDQSYHTDAEGGGGYRFLMYGGGRRKQPGQPPQEEKVYSPGAPVEINLSQAAVSASRSTGAPKDVPEAPEGQPERGGEAEAGTTPQSDDVNSRQDETPAVKHINITL